MNKLLIPLGVGMLAIIGCGRAPAPTGQVPTNPDGVISAVPGSGGTTASNRRRSGLPDEPGNIPDRPMTPKTAPPGEVSPPIAVPAPPVSTSEGP